MANRRVTDPQKIPLKGALAVLRKTSFPYHYKYNKTGNKHVRISNNISAVSFFNTEYNGLTQQLIELYLDDNVKILSDNALNGASFLSSISFSPLFEEAMENCFQNCVNLPNITFTESTRSIGNNCFKNDRNLTSLEFDWFSSDLTATTNASYNLTSIGSNAVDSTANLKMLALPNSIDNVSKINANAFNGSSLQYIVFLGINGSSLASLAGNKCFGLGNAQCKILSKDKLAYDYNNGVLAADTSYSVYKGLNNANPGRMRLGRIFKFELSAVNWCIDYNTRTTATKSDKFPSENCPIIVFFLDPMTSKTSYDFMNNVICNNDFIKKLKNDFHCYLFALYRNGDINSATTEMQFFKNTLNNGKQYEKDFISVNFYYNSYFNSVTLNTSNITEVIQTLTQYCELTHFSEFNYENFNIKLEEPYVETIPTGSDVTTAGYIPWWYSNGTVTTISQTF